MSRVDLRRLAQPWRAALASGADGTWQMPWLLAAIGAAWLVAASTQVTGQAALLHHHNLIEHGPPLGLAVLLFLGAWQVMVTAMMLPASLPSIGRFNATTLARDSRPGWALSTFLAPYVLLWTAFGLLAFAGDVVLHHIVDVTPWLAARPWLIQAGILALAGGYQFIPFKRRSLEACRDHDARSARSFSATTASELGVRHALACLGSSWALMLLMFAEGFANLWWMVGLAAVMVYEAAGRHGQRAATAVGAGLISMAGLVLLTGAARAALG